MQERFLVINTEWPEESRPVQAATLVNFQILLELARRPGVEVGYLKVFSNGKAAPMDDIQKEAKAKLEAAGISYLEPFELPPLPHIRSRFFRLFFPKLVDFYPVTAHRKVAYAAAQVFDPTSIMIQWCEGETHLYSEFPSKKFAYYGNSDAFIERIWSQYMSQFGESIRNKITRNLRLRRLEKFHLLEMNKWDFISCVGLNFAKYYHRFTT